jgi:hypothetical protein
MIFFGVVVPSLGGKSTYYLRPVHTKTYTHRYSYVGGQECLMRGGFLRCQTGQRRAVVAWSACPLGRTPLPQQGLMQWDSSDFLKLHLVLPFLCCASSPLPRLEFRSILILSRVPSLVYRGIFFKWDPLSFYLSIYQSIRPSIHPSSLDVNAPLSCP